VCCVCVCVGGGCSTHVGVCYGGSTAGGATHHRPSSDKMLLSEGWLLPPANRGIHPPPSPAFSHLSHAVAAAEAEGEEASPVTSGHVLHDTPQGVGVNEGRE
jgi:hypothetical protein